MAIFHLMLFLAFPMIAFAAQSKIEGKVLYQLQREFVQDDPILKVTLNYGQYETSTQKNGIFAFYNIPNGRYFLEVHSRYFVYESAFIDVYTSNKGIVQSQINYVIIIKYQLYFNYYYVVKINSLEINNTNVAVSKIHPILRQRPKQQQQSKQQRIQTRDQMLFEVIQRKDYFEEYQNLPNILNFNLYIKLIYIQMKQIIQLDVSQQKEEELSLSSIYQNQYFFMIAITVVMLFFVKKMPMEELQSAERAPQQQ